VLSFLKPLPDARRLPDALVAPTFKQMRASMLVSLTVVYSFYYTCRIGLSVTKKPLIDAGLFNKDELGTIGACLLGAYAVGKLVNGFFADRLNPARFLPLGLALSALANIVMGLNSAFVIACALWLCNGYFQGVGAGTSVKSLTQWFTGSERGRVYGIWSAAHAIGEFLTYAGTSVLVGYTGWRAGFVGPGVACVIVAFIAALLLRDRPQAYGLPEVNAWRGEKRMLADEDHATSTDAAQLEVLKLPAVWVCGLASALMYVTRYGVNSWGVLYLQETRGYSLEEAGGIVGVSAFTGFAGSIAYGILSDVGFKGRRPPATLIFGIIEVLALLVVFYGPTGSTASTLILMGAFAVYGFTLSGILAVLGGLFAVDISSKKAAGLAMGFIGFLSYVGAVIQERLSGSLLEKATTKLADGSTHVDFAVPVQIWIGASIASIVVAATLWNVKAKE
jgi:OPA family sugar phosphate sensor protein UhpC-like MFS transporter